MAVAGGANIEWGRLYLPGEVSLAAGTKLVDITADVYDEYSPATYLNVAGTGYLATVNSAAPDDLITAADVTAVAGTRGNTDGYDLGAIRVRRCAPQIEGDTATDMSETRILDRGTWFMHNYYGGPGIVEYDIQAGNPEDGLCTIGTLTVGPDGSGGYVVSYDTADTIEIGGWIYDVEVVDEHLAISDTMSFTAVPGRDDNQDFGVAFADADDCFHVFAHPAVEYR